MASEICVNIGSGNGLLPDGTKPLPEPMLTDHQWSPVTFILGQFHKRCLNHRSLKSVWKLHVYNFIQISQGPNIIYHTLGLVGFGLVTTSDLIAVMPENSEAVLKDMGLWVTFTGSNPQQNTPQCNSGDTQYMITSWLHGQNTPIDTPQKTMWSFNKGGLSQWAHWTPFCPGQPLHFTLSGKKFNLKNLNIIAHPSLSQSEQMRFSLPPSRLFAQTYPAHCLEKSRPQ